LYKYKAGQQFSHNISNKEIVKQQNTPDTTAPISLSITDSKFNSTHPPDENVVKRRAKVEVRADRVGAQCYGHTKSYS
jgi:hypothetical protein